MNEKTSDITVLKIGGSVITDKSSDEGVAKEKAIIRIAREISFFEGRLIIVHGAGSFGHPQAQRYALADKYSAEGSAVTHRSVASLNESFVNALAQRNVNAVGVHPMGCFVAKRGRISESFLPALQIMLEKGITPVLHGDVVMDTVKGSSVISGDQIVPYLASKLNAYRIGVGSAEDGVLDEHGHPIPLITPDNFEVASMHIGGSENTDVTGGMLGKVKEMLEMSRQTKVPSYIFNANAGGNVMSFLRGEMIGTAIKDKA
ncbi:isopentenyl phosphate kinase [Methanohalophilus profundi]|uniref:isopentenyl phosphate kinase n=1 Tax=Methanohalophilus profundi TaxID=2138083 RepID=UPI00101DC356|nr:isopentenyl phosphate kinase [Methanohalophilus profundi]